MVGETINAVAGVLKKAYGATVYGAEKPMQHFKTPSFLINLVQVGDKARLGGKFHRTIPLVIQYFPENEENLSEAWRIADTILRELEWITLGNGDLLRGDELRCEMIDGVLNTFVTYTISMENATAHETSMEELLLETGRENGNG